MLKISLGSSPRRSGRRQRLRSRVYPGQKVSRKYRMAVVRRMEYKKLQKLIPTIATRRRVPELTVILEAVKYIDELHSAIADRVKAFQSRQLLFRDRKSAGGGSDVIGITDDGTRLSTRRGAVPMSSAGSHLNPFSINKGTSSDRHSVNNSRESFQNSKGSSSS